MQYLSMQYVSIHFALIYTFLTTVSWGHEDSGDSGVRSFTREPYYLSLSGARRRIDTTAAVLSSRNHACRLILTTIDSCRCSVGVCRCQRSIVACVKPVRLLDIRDIFCGGVYVSAYMGLSLPAKNRIPGFRTRLHVTTSLSTAGGPVSTVRLFVCPGAAPGAYSCFAHVRPCAQGRCGRCPLGFGMMSIFLFLSSV